MPASNKMLKAREHAANRAAGIGDESGRLPSRVKAPEVQLKCTACGMEIRATKTNTEARQHSESRHPASTFALCFPGAFDPTVAATAPTSAATSTEAATKEMSELKVDAKPAADKPKKKAADLSFLDASLDPKAGKKK